MLWASSAAASASRRMLRLVAAASSRQSILCHRVIVASPESPNRNISFTFDSFLSRFPSLAEQSRGFARGGRLAVSEEDDDQDYEDSNINYIHKFDPSDIDASDMDFSDIDVSDIDVSDDEEDDEEDEIQQKKKK